VRLFERALRESLDGAMSPDRTARIVALALTSAGLMDVPEDLGAFQSFVQGSLKSTLLTHAGPAVTETCIERLSHVLWMASSTVRAAAPTPAELATIFDAPIWDDESGLRTVDSPPPVPPSKPSAPADPIMPVSPRRSPTLGRIATVQVKQPPPSQPRVSIQEVVGARAPAPARTAVLVISLDAGFVAETDRELRDVRAVVRIASQAELVRAMTAHRDAGYAVVVDAAMPSVEIGTFAGFASLLPPGTRVVLWGTSAKQKQRLVAVFPQAATWIASGDASSIAALLDS
jgi:hypothetical protein